MYVVHYTSYLIWFSVTTAYSNKIQSKLDLATLDLGKKLDLVNNLGTPEYIFIIYEVKFT